jgi:hypothetical protein
MAEPQAKPVRRYTVDGELIRTGHHIGSLVQTRPHADNRVEALETHIAERKALDNDEKNLVQPFLDAEAQFTGGAAQPLEQAENGLDAAIMAMNDAAGERVAYARLTTTEKRAQKTATALADVLAERGIVAEPPSSTESDESDESDEPAYDADGFYETASGLYEVKDGQWSPVQMADEDEEEPPQDQWPNYTSSGNDQFVDATDNDDDEEEDYDDEAA